MSRALVDRAFNKGAATYEQHGYVQQQVADRLLSFLTPNQSASHVIDVGCGVGLQGSALQALYPKAEITLIDRAAKMCEAASRHCPHLRVLQADAASLPLASQSVDCLFSSAMLQWSLSLSDTLAEWCRVLKPGGLAVISCFLEGSLIELKRSSLHVNTLPTWAEWMHCLSLLPVTIQHQSTSSETAWFASLKAAVEHLRGVGAQTVVTQDRNTGLLTPMKWKAMRERYQAFQGSNGLLPLTYEVGYVIIQRQ